MFVVQPLIIFIKKKILGKTIIVKSNQELFFYILFLNINLFIFIGG